MSVSKGWRSDLERAKTVLDSNNSVRSALFQQIDLTRFLDDDYVQKLHSRNELSASSKFLASTSSASLTISPSTSQQHHIADDEEISSLWIDAVQSIANGHIQDRTEHISALSRFLVSQTTALCEGNVEDSMHFKRRLLMQRVILSQTDSSQSLASSTKKTANTLSNGGQLMDNLQSSESFVSLPFEAQIGIKMLLGTLQSFDAKQDRAISCHIIKTFIPHLNEFITTLCSKYYASGSNNYHNAKKGDFGLLKSICTFLCSMIEVLDDEGGSNSVITSTNDIESESKQENDSKEDIESNTVSKKNTNNDDDDEDKEEGILSPILSIILALSIISSDLDLIIYVIHRILTRKACQELDLCVHDALRMISIVETPLNTTTDSKSPSFTSFAGGSLYVFGKGENGRLGLADYESKQCTKPTLCPKFAASNCMEMSCFSSHNLCLDTEGLVYSWGKGEQGRLGTGKAEQVSLPKLLEPLRSYKAVHVAVGLAHSLVLMEDGSVWSFGCGEHGRLGHGDSAEVRSPKRIDSLSATHIAHICCGAYHCCGISSNGTLFCWGKNNEGQCGLGSVANKDVMVPTEVNLDSAVSSESVQLNAMSIPVGGDTHRVMASYCASGWEHTLLITTEGLALSWGIGYESHRPVLGHGTEKAQWSPKVIDALAHHRIVDVACGWDHSMAIGEKGDLWTWGDGAQGRLGHGDNRQQSTPKKVDYFKNKKVKLVSCRGGSTHSAAISDDGGLWMWGNGTDYQLGINKAAIQNTPMKVHTVKESVATVMLGDKYTMIIPGRPFPNVNSYTIGLVNRNSLAALERRRSSLFSGTPDLKSLISGSIGREQLRVTFEDRLERKEFEIDPFVPDEEKKDDKESRSSSSPKFTAEDQKKYDEHKSKFARYETMIRIGQSVQMALNRMRLDKVDGSLVELFEKKHSVIAGKLKKVEVNIGKNLAKGRSALLQQINLLRNDDDENTKEDEVKEEKKEEDEKDDEEEEKEKTFKS